MLKRITLALLITSFIFAGTPVQDSALNHFPDSTAMLIEIDMPAVLGMLEQLEVKDFAEAIQHEVVEGLLERIETVYVGMPEGGFDTSDSMYVLMRSGLSVQELIDLAVKYGDDGEDVDIRSANIGPFTAFYNAAEEDDEDDLMYIAEAEGFIVAGSENGLMQYADVRSGKVANAGGNAELAALRGKLPENSSLRIYGSAPKEMGDLFNPEKIALGIGSLAENLSMHLMLTSNDAAKLDKLEQQISGLSGMAAMMDETGELAELLQGLEVSRENDAIMLNLNVSMAKLHKIIQSKMGDHEDNH